MRKCYSWIVVLVILGLLLPTNAFASIGDSTGNPDLGRSHVVFEKERITDPAVLFERARQGKTDLSQDATFGKLVFNEALLEQFDVEQYTTTQHLKRKQFERLDGIEDYYETDVFVVLKAKDDTDDEMGIMVTPPPAQSRTKSAGTYDSSYSVFGHVTVSYKSKKFTSKDISQYWAQPTRIRATWTLSDHQCSISQAYVRGRAFGREIVNPDSPNWYLGKLLSITGTKDGDYNYYASVTPGNNYDYIPYWGYVDVYPADAETGGVSEVKITRGGTSWNLQVKCLVKGSDL